MTADADDFDLDPTDQEGFRKLAHEALDTAIDHLLGRRDEPVWRSPDEALKTAIAGSLGPEPVPAETIVGEVREHLMPHSTGNTHPRFFGWVHGTGVTAGLLADILASGMNSNCGGRDHGAVYVEREIVNWCRDVFGFPETASGVLTVGTSQATLIALTTARMRALGPDSRKQGIIGGPKLTAYAAAGTHGAIKKAVEVMGLGSEALRLSPSSADNRLDPDWLRRKIAEDRAGGALPFCVIATAGSVNTGVFDDIPAIADICAEEGLWLHIDGAFGAWTRIAPDPWNTLVDGIERADSIAADFHKWMYVQYDCGMVLIRDGDAHWAAFAERPTYLAPMKAGTGGGDPWFCDYGVDLSRGFRALKVWMTIREHGATRLGAKIGQNCEQARLMRDLADAHPLMEPMAPAVSNLCVFRYRPEGLADAALDSLNDAIAIGLQEAGETVFSTTRIDGKVCLRAAIVNHRTRSEDIRLAMEEVAAAGARLTPDFS